METVGTKCTMHIAPTALHRPFEVRDLKMSPPNTDAISATVDPDCQRVAARSVVTYSERM